MELTCSTYEAPSEVILDPNAQDFSPKRNATVAANERKKEVTDKCMMNYSNNMMKFEKKLPTA